jgi:hypothetical protein
MRALEPGIYKATVRGVADQIVMLTDSNSTDTWITVNTQRGGQSSRWFSTVDITDVRPLIVLDLSDPAEVVKNLRDMTAWSSRPRLSEIADQIEAQTKVPRIPEPTESGTRVMSRLAGSCREREEFLRITSSDSQRFSWVCLRTGDVYRWAALIDPNVIHQGQR